MYLQLQIICFQIYTVEFFLQPQRVKERESEGERNREKGDTEKDGERLLGGRK